MRHPTQTAIHHCPRPPTSGRGRNGNNVDGTSLNFVSCAAGAAHTLLLTAGGMVFACGRNRHGQLGLGKRRHAAAIKAGPTGPQAG